MSAVCPTHQVAWVIQPAGISRTSGQPYNAFLKCPIQGCRERPPRQAPTQQTAVATQVRDSSQTVVARQNPKDARYAHALAFAGSLFQGRGSEAVTEAMELARHIAEAWPNE